MHIAHLTSAHTRYDTRIFLKQCRSLAAHGNEVTLVVADGKGGELRDGVRIVDVGKPRGRLDRMTAAVRKVSQRARELRADLYHLHDPELLLAGLKLKQQEFRVVFDAHENVPLQIRSKPYLYPWTRRGVSHAFSVFERYVCRRLDGVVAATPFIRDKFLELGARCTDINNFPLLGELESGMGWTGKQNEVCYVGGITAIRGVREIVRACGLARSNARLNLCGTFTEPQVEAEVRRFPEWDIVNEYGFIGRDGVRSVMGRSLAGLVTFLPEPNHINAQPNKMFEYMSAGLPVVASNFPLWRQIIEGGNCGLCVDPTSPAEIAVAVDRLAESPELSRRLGENGRRCILEKYNWAIEEKKLLDFYADLVSRKAAV